MGGAAARIAHVVQAIEHGDQVEIPFGDLLGGRGFEPHPIGHAVRLRMLRGPRAIDGSWKSKPTKLLSG